MCAARVDRRAAPGAVGQLIGPAAARPLPRCRRARFLSASAATSIRFGVVSCPTQRPIRNGSAPQRSCVLAPEHFAGTDERRGTLELLERQHAQRVSHQHRNAGVATPAAERPLQPPKPHHVGGEAQVRLRLAAAGRDTRAGRAIASVGCARSWCVGSVMLGRLSSTKASWNGYQRRSSGTAKSSSGLLPPRRRCSDQSLCARCSAIARFAKRNASRRQRVARNSSIPSATRVRASSARSSSSAPAC